MHFCSYMYLSNPTKKPSCLWLYIVPQQVIFIMLQFDVNFINYSLISFHRFMKLSYHQLQLKITLKYSVKLLL